MTRFEGALLARRRDRRARSVERGEAAGRDTGWVLAPSTGLPASDGGPVGVVAFAVFAAAAVFAWDLSHPDPTFGPNPSPAMVDLASELPEGWSELPAPPEVRSGAATAWTGSQLLVWGGYEYLGGDEDPSADGFVFNVVTRRWESLPPSPIEGRSDAAFAWTEGAPDLGRLGRRVPRPAVLRRRCGVRPGRRNVADASAGAHRSSNRVLRVDREGVGRLGKQERAARRIDGAAYDPITNAWRSIPDGPTSITDGSAVWTGDETIVRRCARRQQPRGYTHRHRSGLRSRS